MTNDIERFNETIRNAQLGSNNVESPSLNSFTPIPTISSESFGGVISDTPGIINDSVGGVVNDVLSPKEISNEQAIEEKNANLARQLLNKQNNLGLGLTESEQAIVDAYTELEAIKQEQAAREENKETAIISDELIDSPLGQALNLGVALKSGIGDVARTAITAVPRTERNLLERGTTPEEFSLFQSAKEKKGLKEYYTNRIDNLKQSEPSPERDASIEDLTAKLAAQEYTPEEAKLFEPTKRGKGRNRNTVTPSKFERLESANKIGEFLDAVDFQAQESKKQINTKFSAPAERDLKGKTDKAAEEFSDGNYLKGTATFLGGVKDLALDDPYAALQVFTGSLPYMVSMVAAAPIMLPAESAKLYDDSIQAFKAEYNELPTENERALMTLIAITGASLDKISAGVTKNAASIAKSIVSSSKTLNQRLPSALIKGITTVGAPIGATVLEGATEGAQNVLQQVAGTIRDPKVDVSEALVDTAHGAIGGAIFSAPGVAAQAVEKTAPAVVDTAVKATKAVADKIEKQAIKSTDAVIEKNKDSDPKFVADKIISDGLDGLNNEQRTSRLEELIKANLELKKQNIEASEETGFSYDETITKLIEKHKDLTLKEATGRDLEEHVENSTESVDSINEVAKAIDEGADVDLKSLNIISGSILFKDASEEVQQTINNNIKLKKNMSEVSEEVRIGDKEKGTKGIQTYIKEMTQAVSVRNSKVAEDLINKMTKWRSNHISKLAAFKNAREDYRGERVEFKIDGEDKYYIPATDELIDTIATEIESMDIALDKITKLSETITQPTTDEVTSDPVTESPEVTTEAPTATPTPDAEEVAPSAEETVTPITEPEATEAPAVVAEGEVKEAKPKKKPVSLQDKIDQPIIKDTKLAKEKIKALRLFEQRAGKLPSAIAKQVKKVVKNLNRIESLSDLQALRLNESLQEVVKKLRKLAKKRPRVKTEDKKPKPKVETTTLAKRVLVDDSKNQSLHISTSKAPSKEGTPNGFKAKDVFKAGKISKPGVFNKIPNFFGLYKKEGMNKDIVDSVGEITIEEKKILDTMSDLHQELESNFKDRISFLNKSNRIWGEYKDKKTGEQVLSALDQNPLGYLVKEDAEGNRFIDDNIIGAMTTSLYNWLSTQSTKTLVNTKDDMNSILGRDSQSPVSQREREVLTYAGSVRDTVVQALGRPVVRQLGLEVTDKVDGNMIERLSTAIGITILGTALNKGYVTERKEDINKLIRESGLDYERTGNTTRGKTTFIRLADSGTDKTMPTEFVSELVTTNKLDPKFVNKVFGFESFQKYVDTAPVTSVPKYLKNTLQKLPKKLKNYILWKQQIQWGVKPKHNAIFSLLDRKALRNIAGYKEDLSKEHISERLSAEAINADIERQLDNYEDSINQLEDTTAPIYFSYDANRNNRSSITNNMLNPVTSKIHRHLVGAKAWEVEVPSMGTKNAVEVRTNFKLAIAQAFGYRIDAKNLESSLAEFDRLIEDPTVKAGVEALRTVLETDGSNPELEADIQAAVELGGEKFHTLDGLVALIEYHPTQSFTTDIGVEVDGVTNGIAIGLMQAPLETNVHRLLRSVGIYLNGRKGMSYPEWASNPSNLDLYKTLTSNWLRKLDENTSRDGKDVMESISKLIGSFVDTTLVEDEVGNVVDTITTISSLGRNIAKSPMMLTSYGAAISKTVENLSVEFISRINSEFSKAAKLPTEAEVIARTKEIVDNINNIVGTNYFEDVDYSNPIEILIPYQAVRDLTLTIENIYGETLAESLKESFPEFFEFRNAINGMMNAAFRVFDIKYREELANKSKELNRVLSRDEEKEIFNSLKEYQPLIKSALSTGLDDSLVLLDTIRDKDYGNPHATVQVRFGDVENLAHKSIVETVSHVKFDAPGARALVYATQSQDAAIQVTSSGEYDFLDVFDAQMLAINDVDAATSNLNKSFWEVTSDYTTIDSVYESFKRVLDLTKGDPELDTAIFNEINKYAKDGESITVEQFNRDMVALKARVNRERKAIQSVSNTIINQYAHINGTHIVNEKDSKETAKSFDEEIGKLIDDVFEEIKKEEIDVSKLYTETSPIPSKLDSEVSKQLDALIDLYSGPKKEAITKKSKQIKNNLLSFVNDSKKLLVTSFEGFPSTFKLERNKVGIEPSEAAKYKTVVIHELTHAATVYGLDKALAQKNPHVLRFSRLLEDTKDKVLAEINNLYNEGLIDAYSADRLFYIYTEKHHIDSKDVGAQRNSRMREAMAILAIEPRVRRDWINVLQRVAPESVVPVGKSLTGMLLNLINRVDEFLQSALAQFMQRERSADRKFKVPDNSALDALYKATFVSLALNNTIDVEANAYTTANRVLNDAHYGQSTVGSSVNPIDFDNFNSIFDATLSSENTLQIFDMMDGYGNKKESESHKAHLKDILSNVVNSVLKASDNIEFKVGETAEVSHGAALRRYSAAIGEKVYINASTANRMKNNNEMSMQEIQVHELLHAIADYGIDNDFHSRKELIRLFNITKKAIEDKYGKKDAWKIFLNRDSNNREMITVNRAEEVQAAKDRYNYIFNNTQVTNVPTVDPLTGKITNKKINAYLKEFVSFGLTNEKFINILSEVDTTPKVDLANVGIFQRLKAWFDAILNKISGKIYKTRDMKADQALRNLVEHLTGITSKQRNTALRLLDSTRDLNSAARNFMYDKILEPFLDWRINQARRPETVIGKTVNAVALIPAAYHNSQLRKNIREVLRRIKLTEENFIIKLVREIQGSKANNLVWHTLLRQSKHLVDSARKAASVHVQKYIHDSFQAGLPTDDESRAITRVMYKSDMSSLINKYTMPQLIKLLRNSTYLNNQIKSTEQELNIFGNNTNYYINQSRGLGNWMATGTGQAEMQALNAHNIAKLTLDTRANSSSVVGDVAVAEEIIDRLATLYSLKAMTSDSKTLVSNVMDRENEANNQDNGIISLLNLQNQFKEDSLRELFGGNKTQTRKGYIHETFNPRTDIKIATDADKDELIKSGYVPEEGYLPIDGKDSNKIRRRMYVLKNSAGNVYQKSIVSVTSKTAMGSSLLDGYITTGSSTPKGDSIRARKDYISKASNSISKQFRKSDVFNDKPTMIPLVDEDGNISDFRYTMSEAKKISILERDDRFDTVMGNMFGNIKDKVNSKQVNRRVVELAYEDYRRGFASDPNAYVKISSQTSEKRYNEIYRLIPEDMRTAMEDVWGDKELVIRREMADLIFGYRKWSIGHLFEDRTQAQLQAIHKALNNGMVRHIEAIWQEVVTVAKTNIVIRTPAVLIGNFISNAILSMVKGVPVTYMLKHQALAMRALDDYQKSIVERDAAKLKLSSTPNLTPAQIQRLESKIARLDNELTLNPVSSMIDEGVFQAIVEDIEGSKSPYDFRDQALQKTKLDKIVYSENKFVRETVQQSFMTEETTVFKLLMKATQYSDFVARFALHKYNTEERVVTDSEGNRSKGMDHDESLRDVIETFINYDIPTSKQLQYMNDMGFFMFSKFLFRIQKVIFTLFKDRPVSVGMSILLQQAFMDAPDVVDSLGLHLDGRASFIVGPLDAATTISGINAAGDVAGY